MTTLSLRYLILTGIVFFAGRGFATSLPSTTPLPVVGAPVLDAGPEGAACAAQVAQVPGALVYVKAQLDELWRQWSTGDDGGYAARFTAKNPFVAAGEAYYVWLAHINQQAVRLFAAYHRLRFRSVLEAASVDGDERVLDSLVSLQWEISLSGAGLESQKDRWGQIYSIYVTRSTAELHPALAVQYAKYFLGNSKVDGPDAAEPALPGYLNSTRQEIWQSQLPAIASWFPIAFKRHLLKRSSAILSGNEYCCRTTCRDCPIGYGQLHTTKIAQRKRRNQRDYVILFTNVPEFLAAKQARYAAEFSASGNALVADLPNPKKQLYHDRVEGWTLALAYAAPEFFAAAPTLEQKKQFLTLAVPTRFREVPLDPIADFDKVVLPLALKSSRSFDEWMALAELEPDGGRTYFTYSDTPIMPAKFSLSENRYSSVWHSQVVKVNLETVFRPEWRLTDGELERLAKLLSPRGDSALSEFLALVDSQGLQKQLYSPKTAALAVRFLTMHSDRDFYPEPVVLWLASFCRSPETSIQLTKKGHKKLLEQIRGVNHYRKIHGPPATQLALAPDKHWPRIALFGDQFYFEFRK